MSPRPVPSVQISGGAPGPALVGSVSLGGGSSASAGGGLPTNLLQLLGYISIRDAGADLTGTLFSDVAAQSWISIAALSGGVAYLPAGTVKLSQKLTYPAGKRLVIKGLGPGVSTLKWADGGSGVPATVIDTLGQTHLEAEWECALEDLTIDLGNAAGPGIFLTRSSLFRMRNVRIKNGAGCYLWLDGAWDPTIADVFCSDLAAASGDSIVVLEGNVANAEETVEARFTNLRIEGNTNKPFVDIRGTAGAKVRYNVFLGSKLHGDPTTGNPNGQPLVKCGANSFYNTFDLGEIAYGRLAPQIQDAGQGNSFNELVHIIRDANPPTFAYQADATAVDSTIRGHRSTSASFVTALLNIVAGASRVKARDLDYVRTLTLATNAGFETDLEQPDARAGLTDGANVTPDAAKGKHQDLVAAATPRTILAPLNPVDGWEIDVTILNNSGGAIVITFTTGSNDAFLLAGAITNPANGTRRSWRFRYAQYLRRWIEISRAAADIV